MRKKLLFIIFFISFLVVFLLPTAAAKTESIEGFSVDRTLHINYDKILHVMDEYLFKNTGTDPLSSLILEIPYSYSSYLASFEVFGSSSEKLTFEKLPYDGSGFLKWRVYLNTPLKRGDTVLIKNRIAFFGLCTDYYGTLDGSYGHINFNIFKYPTSPYYIRNCSVRVTCDPSVTIYNSITGRYYSTLLLVSRTSLSKNNDTSYIGRFNLTDGNYGAYKLSAMKFTSVKREIRYDPWGYLYVYEEHAIENIGPYGFFRITTYTLNLPIEAENVYVSDGYGSLSFAVTGETTKNLTIYYSSTRYALQTGEKSSYWVTYRIPSSNYVQSYGDKIKLSLDVLFGSFNGLVENFEISLILPKDSSLNYIHPFADSIITKDNSIVLIFNEYDVTSFNSNLIELELDVSKSYLQIVSRPFLFILLFAAACSSYVITKRLLPAKEGAPTRATVVPTPILLEFCSLFEEKISLVTEIEKMDEDLKKRKIKKRIYRNQLKTAERKIMELNKDIEDLKIHLKTAGGRFAQIANELEINEAERESSKDGLYNLEQRYLRKKISVLAYQKLNQDLIERQRKAKTKIDKLIFELREVLS